VNHVAYPLVLNFNYLVFRIVFPHCFVLLSITHFMRQWHI